MTNWRQKTVDTYNHSAKELAEYFRGIGPRSNYIELALAICGKKNPKVLEIGCGDGRDAREILQHTPHYLGFDPANEAIRLARETAPDGTFFVADATTFAYPLGQDVVFAFASILHLDEEALKVTLQKVQACLNTDGVFYISTKYSGEYRSEVKKDTYGERMFYYYNPSLVEKLAGDGFGTVTTFRETIGSTSWFELVLQKV
jgi:SAM-dependent methyltransferase